MDERKGKEREGEGDDGARGEKDARVYKAPSLSLWKRREDGERGLGRPGKRGGGEKEKLRVYPEMPSGVMTIVTQNEGR